MYDDEYGEKYDEMINFNDTDTIITNRTNPEVYAYSNVANRYNSPTFGDQLYEDNEDNKDYSSIIPSQDDVAEARNHYGKIYNRIITCQNI